MKKILLLLCICLIGGCSFLEKPGPEKNALTLVEEKQVVIYSSGNQEVIEKVAGRFRKAYPDYRVEIRQMGGGDALEFLGQEKKSPQGDLWWGANPAELIAGKKQGLFRTIPEPISNLVGSFYRDSDRQWIAESLVPQAFVTAFSTSGDRLPWQWEDMALPKYQNQLFLIPPSLDQSYNIWLGAVMYRKGYFQRSDAKNWLLGIDANTRAYFTEERALLERLIFNPGTITWMSLPDAIRWREKEGFPLKIYLPQGSQPVYFYGVALLQDSPHPRGAELFLQFLYSDEIQGDLIREDYRISARTSLPQQIKPNWYDEWSISPQDLDWEWIAGMEGQNLLFWQEEINGHGVIVEPQKEPESSLKKEE